MRRNLGVYGFSYILTHFLIFFWFDREHDIGGTIQEILEREYLWYGFGSLLAFKAKFQPEYRPLFMAYPESAALPAIGGAVARAYLPDLTVPQGLRLAGRALRGKAVETVTASIVTEGQATTLLAAVFFATSALKGEAERGRVTQPDIVVQRLVG